MKQFCFTVWFGWTVRDYRHLVAKIKTRNDLQLLCGFRRLDNASLEAEVGFEIRKLDIYRPKIKKTKHTFQILT